MVRLLEYIQEADGEAGEDEEEDNNLPALEEYEGSAMDIVY